MLKEEIIPDYPRTRHLPWNPNAQREDLVATKAESKIIFTSSRMVVEEKIDGANCGMCVYDDHPLIRNRNSFIHKGNNKVRTPAKMQFASIFNWFYENIDKFKVLNNSLGYEVSIYGEWLYALHGIKYDQLPSYFVAFDVYDFNKRIFLDPLFARSHLNNAGFNVVPLLHEGPVEDWTQLEELCQKPSLFSTTDTREGVYVKIGNGKELTHRFKMVRPDFVQGCNWSKTSITKNKVG